MGEHGQSAFEPDALEDRSAVDAAALPERMHLSMPSPQSGSTVGTVSPIAMKLSVLIWSGSWTCADPRCCLPSSFTASAKRGSVSTQYWR